MANSTEMEPLNTGDVDHTIGHTREVKPSSPSSEHPKPTRTKTPLLRRLLPFTLFLPVLFYLAQPFRIPAFSLSSLFFDAPDPNARFILSPSVHGSRAPQVREYDFVIDEEVRWPDGVQKRVFTVNGLFPGPTLELRSGDTLRLLVKNLLPEGTSIHFHGVRHPDGSVSQDGSIGLTQCPIPPNGSYTYEFRTDERQSGTFWWHSHHATQRADGLFGALILHPPSSPAHKTSHHQEPRSRTGALLSRASQLEMDMAYDTDTVMLIGDWFHRTGEVMFDWYWNRKSGGNEPVPDNALVNGQQIFGCERSLRKIVCDPEKGTRPVYYLDPGKKHKLRFINTGSLAQSFISVDAHELLVVEADGTHIEPVWVKELAVAPGQRYAVILKYVGDKSLKGQTFWLRHRLDQSCFKYPNQALDPEPKAIISYTSPPRSHSSLPHPPASNSESNTSNPALTLPIPGEPTSARWTIEPEEEFDARTLLPRDMAARILPETTAPTVMMYANTMKKPSHGQLPWGYINQTSWRPNERAPLMIMLPPEGEYPAPEAWGTNQFVVTTSRNESVVMDIIVNNLEDGLHPFHLHGHHFWPLYVSDSARYGWGSYVWDRPPTLPTVAPALRDTFVIPLRSYAVFRVKFDTPGMWMFHCHVLVHLKSGMAMAFDVMRDLVPEEERRKVRESCAPFAEG